jgi:hypothetical protein
MTGWAATLDVRVNQSDLSPLISISTMSSANGVITFSNSTGSDSPPLNQFNIWITAFAMSLSGVTPGLRANFDLLMLSLAGQEIKVLSGPFIVGPTYTH